MFGSLNANYVRMVIAGSSVVVSLLIAGFTTTWVEIHKCWGFIVWPHVCLLQIVGGIFLFVGSSKVRQIPCCIKAYKRAITGFSCPGCWQHAYLSTRYCTNPSFTSTIWRVECYLWFPCFNPLQDFLQMHTQSHRTVAIMESLQTEY
ncbi:uncharacterized protein LOC117136865 isoform X1 [Drosophila mauritiana]|uniref:Uncharacterized protein LOC117136865 isoform X1 n=1 Tax=Drosophila mauritiana TaxID=7226 RepID=A0A6P8JE91_DROMA|nr:uncharacterized protein LOC117136865 isoform X1 [Drosophila mauritiana]